MAQHTIITYPEIEGAIPNPDITLTTARQRLTDERRIARDHGDPYHRDIATKNIENLQKWIRDIEAGQRRRAGEAAERAQQDAQREQDARAKLERQLMDTYRQAAPGTSEDEAKAALPDLLHRRRLEQMNRHEEQVAKARASGKYIA